MTYTLPMANVSLVPSDASIPKLIFGAPDDSTVGFQAGQELPRWNPERVPKGAEQGETEADER